MIRGLFNLKIDYENKPIIRAKKKTKQELNDLMEELNFKFD